MERVLDDNEGGRTRKRVAEERINTYLAEKLEETIKADKRETSGQGTSSSSNQAIVNPAAGITNMDMEEDIAGGTKRKREDNEEEEMKMEDVNFLAISDMCAAESDEINNYHDGFTFHDESTGELLDSTLVAKACSDELNRFRDMQVYDYVHRNDVPLNTKIVGVKWVHVNKGTVEEPNIRCRLVCQAF